MQRITYLNENLKNETLIRWPEQCLPIPVYIAPCKWYSLNGSSRNYYNNMVVEALNAWENISSGKVSFLLVNSLLESLINVDWRRVDRKSLGDCRFVFDRESRLSGAEVSIGISDGILHNEYMDENEVFHTILHEIGHSLGLGHSPDMSDIMYTPHQYGVINLSQRDRNSLFWLYSLPYGTTISSLNSKYSTNFSNIDDIIAHIVSPNSESQFQKTMKNIRMQSRNLVEENANIGDLKRYQVAFQDIKLPKELSDKFKQTRY